MYGVTILLSHTGVAGALAGRAPRNLEGSKEEPIMLSEIRRGGC